MFDTRTSDESTTGRVVATPTARRASVGNASVGSASVGSASVGSASVDSASTAEWLRRVREELRGIDGSDDVERIDLLRALEELKGTAAAVQARVTVAFNISQRGDSPGGEVGDSVGFDGTEVPERPGRGSMSPEVLADKRLVHSVGSQVGLARRESPHRGKARVRFARTVVRLPHTWARFCEGTLSERRAGLIVGAVSHLAFEDQLMIDAELCADPATLEGVGDQRLEGWARRRAAELDPESAVRRAARSFKERRVSMRPSPEGMAWLSALLPVSDAVGAYASLRRAALAAKAGGDPRTISQLMADTLVVRARDLEQTVQPPDADADADAGTEADAGADGGSPGVDASRADAPSPDVLPADVPPTDASSPDVLPADVPPTDASSPDVPPADASSPDVSPADLPPADASSPDVRFGIDPFLSPADAIGATVPAAPIFRIDLIMTDTALFAGGDTPAVIPGIGHLPAQVARDLVVKALGEHELWLRRLYTHPRTGELVACDSHSRKFPPGLASLIALRDQACRSPYCDAPIRHIDHVAPASRGGPTNQANGQGLCAACNYTKEVSGWHTETDDGPELPGDPDLSGAPESPASAGPSGSPGASRPPETAGPPRPPRPPGPVRSHLVRTITPTGHQHRSRPPRVA